MYGDSEVGRPSFLTSMQTQLESGEILILFTDEYRSIASASCACDGLLLAGQSDITGRLHLGGPERLSRWEIGQQLVKHLGLSEEQLNPCLQSELTFKANRPADVSLNSDKAFAMGYEPKSLVEMLAGRDKSQ